MNRFSILLLLCLSTSVVPVGTWAQGAFLIEAEDFNYGGGNTKAEASVMPYVGGAYAGLRATFDIDFNRPSEGSSAAYRNDERIPMNDNSADSNRGAWNVMVNYKLGWIGDGMWFNYTRTFPTGYYKVYAALSYGDTAPSECRGSMQRLTSSERAPNQTLEQLGTFDAPGTGNWGANALIPMKTLAGQTAIIRLGGKQTIRFTAGSGDIDYYKFVVAGPPQIGRHPSDVTVVENQVAIFTVIAANEEAVSYQWQSNQINIAGAVSSNYTFYPGLAANGSRFRCVLSNPMGTTNSTEATLTVTRDTVRPRVLKAVNLGATGVRLSFDKSVSVPPGAASNSFALNNSISVSAAALGATNKDIVLTVSPLTFGATYTVTVNNVSDLADLPNLILPDSTISFMACEYAPGDLGSPPLAGSVERVPGGFDAVGGGSGMTGARDSAFFAWEQRTGNFDLQARVADLTITDPFAQAGLMVRDGMGQSARFAAVFASSAQVGAYFESRSTAGAAATTAAPRTGFPVNYPQMWLRLRRAAAAVYGYASLDGQSWLQLGTVTLSGLPSTLYFGLAVSGASAERAATARFRDVGPTANTSTGTFTPLREPLGPSSRKTGLVLSEIMYHPPSRADGRNLEFVEVYNARAVFEDLTGWRLAGEIDYAFPTGFKLQAGEFVVVAASPDDVKAVYGVTNVVGPYTGALDNQGGTLELRNNADVVRLEVTYSNDPPWPAAAAGAGHSLVLSYPSYGENDPRAWAASELIGGSPGGVDALYPTPLRNVVINELLAHTDPPQLDALELYNHSAASVDLSGCGLSDDRAVMKFRIPDGTTIPARGFLAWDETQLGFALGAAGETVYLVNSNQTRVLDAIKYEGQDNGVSMGRWPDGAPTFRRLAAVTLGTNNAAARLEDLVINEVMFKPISGDDDDQYIELYNRSGRPLDLSGLRFVSGTDFRLPANTLLANDSYLVVARNAARLLTNYPNLNGNNTVGDFGAALPHRGGRIALARHEALVSTNLLGDVLTNWTWVVISEAWYGHGRYAQWADGGGSSLELIDPRADPLQPSSWRDSDESQKSRWTTHAFTGPLDNGNTSFPPDRLCILMQGPGECLVDDVEVLKPGGANLVVNGGFENGASGWEFLGNQGASTVDSTGASTGTRCLHVRGQDGGDSGINTIRRPLAGLADGDTAIFRAKVRWLAGWPEVLFRVHGNYIEMPVRMEVPRNLGTPGLRNSRFVANAGPAIYQVTHYPPLPAANQPVKVTCRVIDPDGVGRVTLRFRIDPNSALTAVTMRDDGVSPDEVPGDGIYTGTIPSQGSGTLAAFRVEAADTAGATVTFPPNAPAQECLVRWDDPVPFGSLTHYHLWSTAATENARGSSSALNNMFRDATVVEGNFRVIYNAGFRDKGSPWHGGAGDLVVDTPADDPLLGSDTRAFASTGNGGSEGTAIRSQLAAWLGQQMGIPYLHAHYMLLYRNGGLFREIMEDLQVPDNQFAGNWFPNGGQGDLYKVAMWYEFDNSNFGSFSPVHATIENFFSQNAYKLARYRWTFKRHPQDGTDNNYTNLFQLAAAANDTTTNYVPRVLAIADIEQWMRVFVFDRVMGNWDSWSYNVGQNMYTFKRLGEPWRLLPWDIDFTFGLGDGPGGSLWGGQDPVINRMYDQPTFRRMLWRAYQEVINGPYLPQNYAPQVDARRKVVLQNNIAGLSEPSSIGAYIDSRRAFVQGQLAASDTSTFAITSNGGADYTSATQLATLTGTAPFAAADIAVNGVPYPVTWTGYTTWQMSVPLTQATNVLALVGMDRFGRALPGLSATVKVRYTGALQMPENYVVLNEIHYNPAESRASFIELYNRSTSTPFDLSGYRLQGVGYTFPLGSFIQPGGYLVLVKNRSRYLEAYGINAPVFDVFPGSLDNGGERIALVRPGATPDLDVTISDVRYDNRLPWPLAADGLGPSLQLVDPARDTYRVGNWASTATNDADRVTPGRANKLRQALPAFPLLWLNEVLPNNVSGLADNAGEREPWIELYNSGATAVDLSPYYLTDTYDNLVKWRFPSGTRLEPGRFLLVWADGQPEQTTAGAIHTNFRLDASSGSVALVRLQGAASAPAVMDYLDYVLISPDRSFGSYPDGQPRKRRLLFAVTPNGPNDSTLPRLEVTVNEFMASNTRTLLDPATGAYEDWFELYNAGSVPADLTSYSLTDDLANPNQFNLPPGYIIPPGGFLLVWADNQVGDNHPTNRDLHVNFRLSQLGGEIGLFDPNGDRVDGITYGAQVDDVSSGRFPDGAPDPLYAMETPTPRFPNVLAGSNRPPNLSLPASTFTVDELTALTFTVTATDPDDGQTVTFSLGADAPGGATLDPHTGAFAWIPTEDQGPRVYAFALRATDNGSPPRTAGAQVTVTVNEVNSPPRLAAVPSQTIAEGSLLTVPVRAVDADLPPNHLVFGLVGDVPTGARIDPETGVFSWTPSEAQGPESYAITVTVSDNGVPPLNDTNTFSVTVTEIDSPPVFDPVAPQTAQELTTFTLAVAAHDPDSSPRQMLYSFDQSPLNARIDPRSGVIIWPITEADGPTTAIFIVRATEDSPARLSSAMTFSVTVTEHNEPPVLALIPDLAVIEGQTLRFTASVADPDLPAQTLVFSLDAGAPEGATIDAASGAFSWAVGSDVGASTNRLTVRVTDDGPGSLSATRTFSVIVAPQWHAVLNEIMYRPNAANAAYVEVFNPSGRTPMDLSGIRLSGNSLTFTFPAQTVLQPGAFAVVAADAAAFSAAYGRSLPLAGVYAGTMDPAGDTLRLVRPGATADQDVTLNQVTFRGGAPWPSAANGNGASLQLIDATQDNNRVGNWIAVPTNGLPTSPQWVYVTATGTAGDPKLYLYLDGPGDVYVDEVMLVEGSTPGVGQNLLQNGGFEEPLTSGWNLTANTANSAISPQVRHAGGASLHLVCNAAGTTQGDSVWQASGVTAGGTYTLSFYYLPGANSGNLVIRTSGRWLNTISDIHFQQPPLLGQFTPGATNNVAAPLAAFPPLRLNEVLPRNVAGLPDRLGHRGPWIELVNTSADPVGLDGLFLSGGYASLTNWAFPSGTSLRAGGFLVVFADAHPDETTADELHAGFALPANIGANWAVALSRLQGAQPAVIDYLEGTVPGDDQSLGRTPDGDPASAVLLPAPTPGASNLALAPFAITEIRVTPDGGTTFAWQAVPGRRYRVEFKYRLDEPAWRTLSELTANSGAASYTEALPPGVGQRYYRVSAGP